MPSSDSLPRSTRIFRIVLAVVVPLLFLSFTISPLVQMLFGDASTVNPYHNQMGGEQLQREIEGYEEVLRREPDNQVALRGLINLYFQQGDYQKAIDPLTRMVELNPEDRQSVLMLGGILLESGEGEKAVELFEPLYAAQPNSPVLLDGLVRAFLLADQAEEATSLLTEQLEESPNNRDLQLQLARVYRQSDRVDEALEIYDQMITGNEQDFVPILEKAVALSQSNQDVEQAEIDALFEQAVSLAPEGQKAQIQQLQTLYSQLGSVNSLNVGPQTESDTAEGESDSVE